MIISCRVCGYKGDAHDCTSDECREAAIARYEESQAALADAQERIKTLEDEAQQQLASKHNFAVVKDIEVRDMPPGRLEVPSTEQQLATAQQELAQWKSMEKMDKACEAATLKECTKEEIYNWTLFFMKKHADARAAVVELAEMVIDEYECHEKSKLMLSCCLIAKDDYQRAVELKRKA